MKTEHLYLHIPFCKTICPYCDFYSLANVDQKIEDYVVALIQQIQKWKNEIPDSLKSEISKIEIGPLKTIFFGGGTPSKLSADQLSRILNAAKKTYGFDKGIEITLETNPGTVDLKKLQEFKQAGVNRISLGVQTLNEMELEKLGREHSVSDSLQAIEWIKAAGFNNFSCDLMLGIPGQTLESYLQTLDAILKYQPQHLSCYMLKVEEGTSFHERQKLKNLGLPKDDATVQMYLRGSELLATQGYEHYEISNFAKPNFEAKHNVAVWQGENYLGLGTGAHSCVNRVQFWYPQKLDAFLSSSLLPEKIGKTDAFDDFSLKIRLKSGINTRLWAQNARFDLDGDFSHIISKYQQLGWLQVEGEILRFTLMGNLFSNQILVDFLDWTEKHVMAKKSKFSKILQ